ncbi:hypothetical protein CO660_06475 [Rhizobium sp. L9]|nr:hypothetical protein CO660_06475 [Rhizobium sp. L9]
MLVTGIQPRRVRAVIELLFVKDSLVPKDLGTLDSCDEHRNEGGEGTASAFFSEERTCLSPCHA